MTQAAAQEQNVERPVSLAALFTAFLTVSLCGVGGGGIVWARRVAVENRRWITDGEFADIVSLCQFMRGRTSSALPSASGRRCGRDRDNRGALRLPCHPVGGRLLARRIIP